MRVGEFLRDCWWILWVISAFGSWVSLKQVGKRIWFFLFAPFLYVFVWGIVHLVVLSGFRFCGSEASGDFIIGVAFLLTLGLYALHCMMYRHDGEDGVMVMSTHDAVANTHQLPTPATRRRFRLP